MTRFQAQACTHQFNSIQGRSTTNYEGDDIEVEMVLMLGMMTMVLMLGMMMMMVL
jgi:hypothetical protein